MTIKDVLDRTTNFFKEKNFDSPRLDAEILLSRALQLKRIDLYLRFESLLTESELESCRALVRRRINGEPIAYILGEKEFYGEVFFVDQSVLIPRPETELLIEAILAWVHQNNIQDKPLKILDLGTGSGCIALSLLKKLPLASASMVDISPEALLTAKKNAIKLDLTSRCRLIQESADLLSLDNEKFDVIVSNPPYIHSEDPEIMEEVKKFEPHQALFASDGGLYFIKSWSKKFFQNLSQHSLMAFELGSKQAEAAREWFHGLKYFDEIKIIKDLSGYDRHIIAERKE